MKSLLKAGMPLAIGSDGATNPFLNIMAATMHPANPKEAMTREEAVTAYTAGAGLRGIQGEARKGSLPSGCSPTWPSCPPTSSPCRRRNGGHHERPHHARRPHRSRNGSRALIFGDLRSFPRSASARSGARRNQRAGRCEARSRGDSSSSDCRRRTGAAVHQREGRGLSARHEPVRHRASRRAGVRHAAARVHQAPRAPGRNDDAADAGETLGRARRRPRTAEGRRAAGRDRPGSRSRHVGRAARSPAGADVLARRRRAVRHLSAGLHEASREAGPQPRHVSDAGLRSRVDRHALADRQGRRLSLRARGGAQRAAAADRLSWRSAGPDPVRGGAAPGKRSRADAGVAHRRRSTAADRRRPMVIRIR